jgi:hypothetical protein
MCASSFADFIMLIFVYLHPLESAAFSRRTQKADLHCAGERDIPSDTKRRNHVAPIEISGVSESKPERSDFRRIIESGDVTDDRRTLGMVAIKFS